MENQLFNFLAKNTKSIFKKDEFLGNRYTLEQKEAYDKAINLLISKKIIYVVTNTATGDYLHKLPLFSEIVEKGGLEIWLEEQRQKEKETQNKKQKEKDLLDSTILTNKVSKRTNIISIIVAILTFAVLLYQVFKKEPEILELEERIEKLEKEQQELIRERLKVNDNQNPHHEERDSLIRTSQK